MELSVIQNQMMMRTRLERGEHPALQQRFRLAPSIPVNTSDNAGHRQAPQEGREDSRLYKHGRSEESSLLDFVA